MQEVWVEKLRIWVLLSGLIGAILSPDVMHAQQWQTYTIQDGLVDNTVLSILEASDGTLWFVSGEGGVSNFGGGSTWRTYTTQDGLSDGAVQSGLKASDGSLWLGTSAGVSHFDGEIWRTYTTRDGLVADEVVSILEASDSSLWFGTKAGVSRFNGNAWQTYTTQDGLIDNYVLSMLEASDGVLWFGTSAGVSRFDGKTWQNFTIQGLGLGHSNAQSILEASDGSLWIGTVKIDIEGFGGGGVSHFDGEVWQTYTTQDGLANDAVSSILEATDGGLWVSTYGGISRFDGEVWQTYTTQDGLANNVVSSILEATDGGLWVSTFGGVSRFDGEAWQTYTTQDGLANDAVVSMFEASDGALWFGTLGSGVSRLDRRTWQTYTTQDGLASNAVSSMLEASDGSLWFGTNEGLSHFDGARWRTYTTQDGLAADFVQSILEASDGSLWISGLGMNRFDGETWQTYLAFNNRSNGPVFSILEASDGSLWFSSFGGVSRFDGVAWQTFTAQEGLRSRLVVSMLEASDGSLWFRTLDGGVSRFDGAHWQWYTAQNGLASDFVQTMLETADGDLWFNTFSGLSRFDGAAWRTYTTQDGLTADAAWTMLETSDGSLWLGTFGGLNRFDGKTWQDFTTQGLADRNVQSILEASDGTLWFGTVGDGVLRFDGTRWQNFTVQDGLGENNVQSILEASDGSLWFRTAENGVSRFKWPRRSRAHTIITRSPPARLGVSNFFFGFGQGEFGTTALPPVSYALVHGTREPHADEWTEFSNIDGFEASGLNSGTWTLYVRAQDRLGLIEPSPASITFAVDLTQPTVAISRPTDLQVVHGNVSVIGFAVDRSEAPDLKAYALEYAPGTDEKAIPAAAWQTEQIDRLSSDPVFDDTLAVWDTEGLTGSYILRLTAVDSLNHQSKTTVRVQVVAAAQEVSQEEGGHIEDISKRVSIYIPPNGLPEDVQVTIAPVEVSATPLPVDPQIALIGPVFGITPENLTLNKPATLTLTADVPPTGEDVAFEKLRLFHWVADEEQWQPVGGTVDPETGQVSAAINQLGTYGLFEAELAEGDGPALAQLACQPRMISPRGGGFGQQMDISFSLGKSATTSVRVFDMAGHLIRTLMDGDALLPGSNVTTWDGRNEDGRAAYAGAYVVLVEAGDKAAKKIVTVVNGQQ